MNQTYIDPIVLLKLKLLVEEYRNHPKSTDQTLQKFYQSILFHFPTMGAC